MKETPTPDRIQLGFADQDVCQRVHAYLSSKHFPRFRNLKIEVDHGVVTVSGRVGSFHERQVALHSCQRVAGVLRLIDAIQVVPDATLSRPIRAR